MNNIYREKAYFNKRKWWEKFILFFIPAYTRHRTFKLKYWRGKFWVVERSRYRTDEFKMKPEFWKCGGGGLPYKYGFGYWNGELLCIYPYLKSDKREKYLSPICKNKASAVFMFLLKRLRK